MKCLNRFIMKVLIDVFKMEEISKDARIDVLIALGIAINYEYSANVTEQVIYELVKILNSNHKILKDDSFLRRAKKTKEN